MQRGAAGSETGVHGQPGVPAFVIPLSILLPPLMPASLSLCVCVCCCVLSTVLQGRPAHRVVHHRLLLPPRAAWLHGDGESGEGTAAAAAAASGGGGIIAGVSVMRIACHRQLLSPRPRLSALLQLPLTELVIGVGRPSSCPCPRLQLLHVQRTLSLYDSPITDG